MSHPAGALPPQQTHNQSGAPAGSAPSSQTSEASASAPAANANNSSNGGKAAGVSINPDKTLTAATLIDAIITHQINDKGNPQPPKTDILKQLDHRPDAAHSAVTSQAHYRPAPMHDVDKVG